VKPEYRSFAQLLISIALRNRHFTYVNASPAPHTWPIVESQGYTRYCNGLCFVFAALRPPDPEVRIEALDRIRHATIAEFELLQRHQRMGCEVIVIDRAGTAMGVVLRRFRVRSGRLALPAMFVIHVSDRAALLRAAGNVGRHLLRKLAPVLVVDADGPESGIASFYTGRRGRKYFKGPHRPALCDLADTEYALFGL
jgi:hypothetical protein